MIGVSGVDMTYADEGGLPVAALRGISLDIARGEFVSVVGPSGCGKSTFLKLLAGLYRPTAGAVTIDGRAVTGPSRDIGLVFQNPILLPWRTVLENALLPVDVLRLDAARFRERAHELLRTMGLEEFEARYPYQLSGGMQQRVAIARALVHDPPILLMDEPFGALDAMTRETLNLELARIWSATGKTVVFVTHNILEAVFLGNRVVVMSPRPGRILGVVDVDLPFPRTVAVMTTPAFGHHAARVRGVLEAPGRDGDPREGVRSGGVAS